MHYILQSLRDIFENIPGYTICSVEEDYVTGYFTNFALYQEGLEQFNRDTANVNPKAYTSKTKDFGLRGKKRNYFLFRHMSIK